MKAQGYSEEYINELEKGVDDWGDKLDAAVIAMRCPECGMPLGEKTDQRDGGKIFYCTAKGHEHFLAAYEPLALERVRGQKN